MYRIYEPNVLEKTQQDYFGWTRPTINWSLECELGGLTREYAYDVYKDRPINTTPARKSALLWYIGSWAIILSMCGPMLACCCSLSSRNNDSSGFACCFGCATGSIIGYAGLLVLSSWAVAKINDVYEVILTNQESLGMYDKINPCVDEYTRVDTEKLATQIETLRVKFSKIHRANWSFFTVTWIPVVLPFIMIVFLILLNDGSHSVRRVNRRDVVNSRALDHQQQENERR